MVMQPYEAASPPSSLAAQEQPTYMGPRVPTQQVPDDDDDGGSYPAQPTFPGPPAPRRYNWIWMLLGALVIAFIAAATTAAFMKGSQAENKSSSSPPPGITVSSPTGSATAPSGSSTTSSGAPATSSSGPASTGAPTADPKADPIGYLEGIRGQIDGYLAQGAAVLDPTAGRDLQNGLSDLESSVQVAKQHGMKGRYLRDVQDKADNLGSKINDEQTQGLVNDTTASALSGELQNFSDTVSNGGGGNN
jgi:hypothetical protein